MKKETQEPNQNHSTKKENVPTTPVQSKSKSKTEIDFHREFSKRLAQALLEKEEEQNQQHVVSSSSSFNRSVPHETRGPFHPDLAHEAYAALCHDLPVVRSDESCTALSHCLMSHFQQPKQEPSSNHPAAGTKYALCDRLVEGIRQVTCDFATNVSITASGDSQNSFSPERPVRGAAHDVHVSVDEEKRKYSNNNSHVPYTNTMEENDTWVEPDLYGNGILPSNSKVPTELSDGVGAEKAATVGNEEDEHEPTLFTQQSQATIHGYAELAFVLFTYGPFQACQEFFDSIQDTQTQKKQDVHTSKNRVTWMENMNMPKTHSFLGSYSGEIRALDQEKLIHSEKDEQDCKNCDHDSMQEIFAEESDPDDYDFGDGSVSNTLIPTPKNDATNDMLPHCYFDPVLLSQPTQSSITTIAQALPKIVSLLQLLTYHVIAPISNQSWRTWKVSYTLSQLTILLIQFHFLSPKSQGKKQEGGETHIFSVASSMLTRPMNALRDRSLDPSTFFETMGDYVRLLQRLLFFSSKDIICTILPNDSYDDMIHESEIHILALTALLDLCSTFQRDKLLDGTATSTTTSIHSSSSMTSNLRKHASSLNVAFTKNKMMIRETVLSTFTPLVQMILSILNFKPNETSSSIQKDNQNWTDALLSKLSFLFPTTHFQESNDPWDIEIRRFVDATTIIRKYFLDESNQEDEKRFVLLRAHHGVKNLLITLDGQMQSHGQGHVGTKSSTHSLPLTDKKSMGPSKRD